MISPLSSAFITAGIVMASNVLDKDKSVDYRLIIGSGVYLLFLSAINESKPEIASKLALIVLITTLFTYGPNLGKKLGVL